MPAYVWKGKTRDGKAVVRGASGRQQGSRDGPPPARADPRLVGQGEGQGGRPAQVRRRRPVQGPGHLHPPVLGHDRRRPAPGAVPGDPGHPAGEQDLRQDPAADAHGRRGRRHPGRRDAQAPEGLRRPLHEHDRGRRGGRYPRHHPEAPGDLHREGGQAQGAGQGRHGVPGRGHLHRRHRDRGHPVEGHPHLRRHVRGPRRAAAAAHADRDRDVELVRPAAARSSSSFAVAVTFFFRRYYATYGGRRVDRPHGPEDAHPRRRHAEDRGGPLLPHPGHPHLLRRAHPRRPGDHGPHRRQRHHRGRDHGRAQGRWRAGSPWPSP